MSTLKVTNLQHPSAAAANVTLDSSGNAAFSGGISGVTSVNGGQLGGDKNIIQNGNFSISQRGTSSSLASGAINYTADRWYAYAGATDQLTATLSQDTDAPEGFGYSAKITTGTPETTVDGNEYVSYSHKIEGYNLQSLAYGTAGAKKTVLSFWVKSSITGTFAINFYQADGGYLIGSTYTINSASTWEHKQIAIDGNALGSIANDNTEGLRLSFLIAAGSDYTTTNNTSWSTYADSKWAYGHAQNGVITTAGATWQLTGVQFEISDSGTATAFQHEDYGTTLQKCLRYFEKLSYVNTEFVLMGISGGTNNANGNLLYSEKRAAPTVDLPNAGQSSGTISYLTSTGGYPSATGDHSIQVATTNQCRIYGFSYTGLTSGGPSYLFSTGSTSISIDAEL